MTPVGIRPGPGPLSPEAIEVRIEHFRKSFQGCRSEPEYVSPSGNAVFMRCVETAVSQPAE